MRERAYEDCRDWCVSRGLRGEVLDTWPVSDVDPLLRDYGQHLFRGGAAVGEFKRVLFAIQDRRRGGVNCTTSMMFSTVRHNKKYGKLR